MRVQSPADGVEAELTAAIARVRGREGAETMACELLERDSRTGLLVGLLDGAEEAIYYDTLTRNVRAVGFGANGVDGLGSRTVETVQHRRDVERFVRKRNAGFEWIHPRFRWVLSVDRPR